MAKQKSAYAQKLLDPRRQKKRLAVLERDEWMCQSCQDTESTLFVHHGYYAAGMEPWDYPLESLHTCCETCHHEADAAREEIKRIVGCLPLEAQTTLVDLLNAFASLGYGDLLCSITALSHPQILADIAESWVVSRLAEKRKEAGE